jgi:hypothetical protein
MHIIESRFSVCHMIGIAFTRNVRVSIMTQLMEEEEVHEIDIEIQN